MEFSEITVRIQNFRAIKDAKLKLNGLTVLSGLNGSGKSTIAKTLYYAIRTALNYEKLLDMHLLGVFERTFQEFSFLIDDLCRSMSRYNLQEKNTADFASLFLSLDLNRTEEIPALLKSALDRVADISDRIASVQEERRRSFFASLLKRANLKLLSLGIGEMDLNAPQRKINEAFLEKVREEIVKNEQKKEKRSLSEFVKLCKAKIDIEIPEEFSYQEGNVEIFDKQEICVRPIQEIKTVCYIDTPWIIDFAANRFKFAIPHAHWREIVATLNKPDDDEAYGLFSEEIASVIKGRASLSKDDPRLFFDRSDDKHFHLRDMATGIKNFSIIQRLAEKGVFNDKTLLILDEPESHLHPQWIAEYARILVLMQKELGVRMLVASHSPDMIDALQTFSDAVGIADKTNFYLAEETAAEPFLYEYRALGNSVSEIFKAFNVAASRIADYEKSLESDAAEN